MSFGYWIITHIDKPILYTRTHGIRYCESMDGASYITNIYFTFLCDCWKYLPIKVVCSFRITNILHQRSFFQEKNQMLSFGR